MSKKDEQDPVEQLKEWEDHMYNPGYWVNRTSPFFPPKPNKGTWILSLIEFVVFGIAFGVATLFYILDPKPKLIIFLVVLFVFFLVACLRFWRFSHLLFKAPNDKNDRSKRER